MIIRFVILCALFLFIEFYSYQAFRALVKLRWVLISYQIISLLLLVFIVYSFTLFDRSVGQTKQTMFTMGLMLLVYVPKIVLTLVIFGEDIFRLGARAVNYFIYNTPSTAMIPSRRKFVSQIALGLAAVPFLSLIYGIFEGKYNFKVFRQTMYFPDLPEAFDGFKITRFQMFIVEVLIILKR